MLRVLLFISLLLLAACTPKLVDQNSNSPEEPTEQVVGEDALGNQILFAGFDIFKGESPGNAVVKANSIAISPGFLKKDIAFAPTIPEGSIKCSLLDAYQNEIKSTLVENPLVKSMEYVSHEGHDHEGHEGHDHSNEPVKLDRKTVESDEGFFQFRARYDHNIRFIRVELTGPDATPGMIYTFPIEEE